MNFIQQLFTAREYYKEKEAYRQEGIQLQAELEKKRNSATDPQAREKIELEYRNEKAADYGTRKPERTENFGFWAKLFFRKKLSAPEMQKQAEVEKQFSYAEEDQKDRLNKLENSIKRDESIARGEQIRSEHNLNSAKKAIPALQNAYREEKLRRKRHIAARVSVLGVDQEGRLNTLPNAKLERLAPVLMRGNLSEDECKERYGVLKELSDQIALRNGMTGGLVGDDSQFDQDAYAMAISKMQGYLQPAVNEVLSIDLTKINGSNLDWYTNEVASGTIQSNYMFMALSDLKAENICPELYQQLGLVGSEIHTRGLILSASQNLARGAMVQELRENLTPEVFDTLLDKENRVDMSISDDMKNGTKSFSDAIDEVIENAGKLSKQYFNGAVNGYQLLEAAVANNAKINQEALQMPHLQNPTKVERRTRVSQDSKEIERSARSTEQQSLEEGQSTQRAKMDFDRFSQIHGTHQQKSTPKKAENRIMTEPTKSGLNK
ncbi:MAG: hypothetical protein R3Y07_02985 [Eubacteriales bacterium]